MQAVTVAPLKTESQSEKRTFNATTASIPARMLGPASGCFFSFAIVHITLVVRHSCVFLRMGSTPATFVFEADADDDDRERTVQTFGSENGCPGDE